MRGFGELLFDIPAAVRGLTRVGQLRVMSTCAGVVARRAAVGVCHIRSPRRTSLWKRSSKAAAQPSLLEGVAQRPDGVGEHVVEHQRTLVADANVDEAGELVASDQRDVDRAVGDRPEPISGVLPTR